MKTGMIVPVGLRKFTAFLLTLTAYCGLFIIVIISDKIGSESIPSFAFQLGMGLAAITGLFYAGNVAAKKVGNDS